MTHYEKHTKRVSILEFAVKILYFDMCIHVPYGEPLSYKMIALVPGLPAHTHEKLKGKVVKAWAETSRDIDSMSTLCLYQPMSMSHDVSMSCYV